MELWIRSQDKERITKIDEVYYSSDDYGYYVMCYKDQFTGYKLGKYKSKERALEVLDEIELYKDKLDEANFLGMTESIFVSSIYIMPKE